jgi:hypothetical protein
MIIVNIRGGLGNQLFQYACAKALSVSTRQSLRIHLAKKSFLNSPRDFTLCNIFNIKVKKSSTKDIKRVLGFSIPSNLISIFLIKNLYFLRPRNFITEPSFNLFHHELLGIKNKHIYLIGYWQSYKYFESFFSSFKEELSFKKEFLKKNEKNVYFESIASSNSVSIHFRRGDYISNSSANKFHGPCSSAYYDSAIKFTTKKVKNPHFFIFSDDIVWAKAQIYPLNLQITFVDNKQDYVDFWLMSLCKNNILANSTFSWWAAWLNKNKSKIVIAPKKWFGDPSILTPDLIPNSWYRI